MQIKTIMRYHLISVRISISNKTRDNKCREDMEKRETLYTVGGNVNSYSHYVKWYGGSSRN